MLCPPAGFHSEKTPSFIACIIQVVFLWQHSCRHKYKSKGCKMSCLSRVVRFLACFMLSYFQYGCLVLFLCVFVVLA